MENKNKKQKLNNQKFKVATTNRIYDCDIKKLILIVQFFLENNIAFNVYIENENELFNKAFKGSIVFLLSQINKGGDL